MTEDNVSDLSVEVLKLIRGDFKEIHAELHGIRGEITSMRGDISATNARVDETNAKLAGLTQEVRVGFAGVRRSGRVAPRARCAASWPASS